MTVYHQAIEHFGENNQMLKCAEECSELAQALIKHVLSVQSNTDSIYAVIQELADMKIMIAQMEIIFKDYLGVLQENIEFKTNRLKGLIENGKGN